MANKMNKGRKILCFFSSKSLPYVEGEMFVGRRQTLCEQVHRRGPLCALAETLGAGESEIMTFRSFIYLFIYCEETFAEKVNRKRSPV